MTIFTKNWIQKTLVACVVALLFTSCYSVRLTSTKGAPNPCQSGIDCIDDVGNFYKDKRVIILDTVIKSGIMTDGIGIPTQRLDCDSGKLFSVEYKNTLGGALLYLVTFGNKRKVRIKYVCMKPEN